MARRRNPARLVIALSVAAVLAVFLLYTSLAGGSTPAIQPSELSQHTGNVVLGGTVVGPITGSAREEGLHFTLRDVKGTETIPVVYMGSVPDLFATGRELMVEGKVTDGTFVAKPDSMKTKCPSKYTTAE